MNLNILCILCISNYQSLMSDLNVNAAAMIVLEHLIDVINLIH